MQVKIKTITRFISRKKKKKIVVEDFVKLHAKNIRILGKLRDLFPNIPSFYKGLMGWGKKKRVVNKGSHYTIQRISSSKKHCSYTLMNLEIILNEGNSLIIKWRFNSKANFNFRYWNPNETLKLW